MSLRIKFIINFFIIVLVSVIFTSGLGYYWMRKNIKREIMNNLSQIAQDKEKAIQEYILSKRERARDFASDGYIRKMLEEIIGQKSNEEKLKCIFSLNKHLKNNKLTLDKNLLQIRILNLQGRIVASTDASFIGLPIGKDEPYFTQGINKPYIQGIGLLDVYEERSLKKANILTISSPIKNIKKDKTIGVLVNFYRVDKLQQLLRAEEDLTAYLLDREAREIISPFSKDEFSLDNLYEEVKIPFIKDAIKKRISSSGTWITPSGRKKMGVLKKITIDSNLYWFIVVEKDFQKAMLPLYSLRIAWAGTSFFILGVAFLFSLFSSRTLIKPLRELSYAADKMRGGDYIRIKEQGDREIKQLAKSFNAMAESRFRYEDILRKLTVAIEQNPAHIIITDTEGNIEYVNHKFTEVLGYSLSEVKGKSTRIFKSGTHNKIFYKKLWDTILRGEVWRGEFFNKKKNGEFYWEKALISPIFDRKRKIVNFVKVAEDVTSLKRIEEENKRLASFPTLNPMPIVEISLSGSIIYTNPAAQWEFPELLSLGGKHPIVEKTLKEINRFSPQNKPFHHIAEVTIKERIYELRCSYLPAQNYSVRIYIVDITDQRKAEESLMASEQRYRSIVDNVHTGINLINPRLEVISSNPQIRQWFGKNLHICLKYLKGDEIKKCPAAKTFKDGKVYEDIIEVKEPDRLRKYRITSSPVIEKEGEVAMVIEMVDDITEELAAERLRREKELVEAKSKAKSEFLAVVSHELRTPLNAVIGFCEILLSESFGPLNNKQKEYLTDIYESGKHLLSLINDILDISKIEEGKYSLQLKELDLKEIVRRSFILISPQAARKNIIIKDEVSGDIEKIYADERKLKQIIYNLLSNAVKFTPQGGKIILKAEKQPEKIKISISDTGIGVEKKDLERIFSPFEQVDSTFSRKFEGSGLGLAIVKELVKLHKGEIWCESEGRGRGATFIFTLPSRQS